MSRSVLVTGAAGFIGANFMHHWAKSHPDDTLVGFDALTYASNRGSLTPLENTDNIHFLHANICNTNAVANAIAEFNIDTLVNFAAESHVDRSISDPAAFIQTNIVGTHSLLAAARAAWLTGDGKPHRFHHISTDEVFGSLNPNALAFTEELRYAPNSPYSASKASSDHLVRAYHHTYGLEVTTSNCSNNYGPFHFPEKLIPLCLTNILDGVPLPIYGDGSNIRDWLYVHDHCRGIEQILLNGTPGENYNIGGNNEWANIDIVRFLCTLVNGRFASESNLANRFPASPAVNGEAESLITFVKDRAGHDWRYAIDARKAEQELGFLPEETFETGIGKTLDWYLSNEPWWRPLIKRRQTFC